MVYVMQIRILQDCAQSKPSPQQGRTLHKSEVRNCVCLHRMYYWKLREGLSSDSWLNLRSLLQGYGDTRVLYAHFFFPEQCTTIFFSTIIRVSISLCFVDHLLPIVFSSTLLFWYLFLSLAQWHPFWIHAGSWWHTCTKGMTIRNQSQTCRACGDGFE